MRGARRYLGGRPIAAAGTVCVLVVALAAAVMGCGATHKQPEQQQIKNVLQSYLHAQVAADGHAACALLTAGGQQQLVILVVKASEGRLTVRPSCEQAVALVGLVAGQQVLNSLRSARIENVRVRGTAATALVVVGINTAHKVSLMKSGAAWKISAVPGLGA